MQEQTRDSRESPPEAPPSLAYRGYVLLLLIFVAAVAAVDRQILFILVEPIRHEFSLSDKQIGALTGMAFALTFVIASIPIARLADRSSRKMVIGVAVSVWSVMTAVSGLAQSFVQLFLARVGVGLARPGPPHPRRPSSATCSRRASAHRPCPSI
ncbi:MFS transporter [Sphingobium sufflavum]|nr:MFS transporter [Sphingobium sufflavum]MCE7795824.1 MFS transporter [Sphingobium sufflavum]